MDETPNEVYMPLSSTLLLEWKNEKRYVVVGFHPTGYHHNFMEYKDFSTTWDFPNQKILRSGTWFLGILQKLHTQDG